jgi:hypothetical protein
MKKILLQVIGIVLMITCAPAGVANPADHPGTFAAAASHQMLVASAAGLTPQGTSVGLAHAGSLQSSSGASGAASSSSNASQVALAMVTVPGRSPLRSSAAADGRQGGGVLVSVVGVPEPSGGAMLLCGLAVLAFIARRKTQPVAD